MILISAVGITFFDYGTEQNRISPFNFEYGAEYRQRIRRQQTINSLFSDWLFDSFAMEARK